MTRPSLSHRLEFAAYRVLERVVGGLSMEACAAFGRGLGGLFHHLSPRYRALVRRNLRIATAGDPLARRELDGLVRETFRRAGTNFLCSLRSAGMSPAALARYTRFEPDDWLERQVADGRGLVVALPHMGNWEVLAKVGAHHIPPGRFGAIYRPLNNPLMDDLVLRRRSTDGARLFSRKAGFHAATRLLREGGVLGVLSDQRAGHRGTVLPFFGKLTTCPPLPRLLARRAKARVTTMTNRSAADGEWRVGFSPPSDGGDLAAVLRSLEEGMRVSLADVFWFHDRWRVGAAQPLSFYTRIDPQVAASATVPLRLVLTMPDAALAHLDAFLAALFEARPDLRIDWLSAEPADPPDPRVRVHRWDRERPDEQWQRVLRDIDDAHPAPLDGAMLFGGGGGLARAARRLGLRSIIGLDVAGKPWHASYPPPADREGWLALAGTLSAIPGAPSS